MLRQESRVKLRRDSNISAICKSDPNMESDVVSKTSTESVRDRRSQQCKEDILPLSSSVSLVGTDIPKILVHTFTREETVESTLSTSENNGLNNV